jgi:hypothetical protein
VVDGDDVLEVAGPLSVPVEPVNQVDVDNVRHGIGTAKRDLSGFVEGDTPFLSVQQAVWIVTRSTVLTDAEACAATGIPHSVIVAWRKSTEFEAVLQESLANKREGFRLLGTQVLPKALLTAVEKMDSKNERVSLSAAKLLMESQGMLITSISKQSKESITELVAFLREPLEVSPTTQVRSTIRGLPSPEDVVNAED